ncbi:hypothetical protein DPMN_051932 [Dreissena polymorpha]|uniref:Uncharacterized protein n=1 Tax=Dreissena polymorpha TaxID=45954 RepID=A0A9D4CJX1_DREPO|nr:hypothetical protein DPMN_051932 [Dreissena polymorpha]
MICFEPQVFSRLPSRILPAASPASPILCGFSSLQNTCAFSIIEAYEIPPSSIPTSDSAGYIQTTSLADGLVEAGSESNVETKHNYLASINQVYKLFLPAPSLSATDFASPLRNSWPAK